MATVDLNHVQFWQPPSNLSCHKQRTAPRKHGSLDFSSQDKRALIHNKADPTFKRTNQPKCAVAATRHPGRDLEVQPEDEGVAAEGTIRESILEENFSNLL